MKYIRQLGVIFAFSALGELLQRLLPLPIPASVYGMVLLFLALALKILPREAVKGAGELLVGCLPLLFVVPIVGLVDNLGLLTQALLPIAVIIVLPTVITFAVAGLVTQRLLKKGEEEDHV